MNWRDRARQVCAGCGVGPGPWTDDILAILAAENVTATFFVVGREAAAEQAATARRPSKPYRA